MARRATTKAAAPKTPLDDYPQDFKRVADYRDWLAQAESSDSEDLFVVTGSLYFISAVRNYLIK